MPAGRRSLPRMVVTCPGFDEIGHTVVKALRGFPMKRQPMPERKDMASRSPAPGADRMGGGGSYGGGAANH